jgi:uncharacterized membrane protein
MTSILARSSLRRGAVHSAFHLQPTSHIRIHIVRMTTTVDALRQTVQSAVDTVSGKPGFSQTDVKDLYGKVCVHAMLMVYLCLIKPYF